MEKALNIIEMDDLENNTVTKVMAYNGTSSPLRCSTEPVSEPFLMFIFGASGDLTSRKLIPALFNLARHGLLPSNYSITGVARSGMDDSSYRESLASAMSADAMDETTRVKWDDFVKRVSYLQVRYDRRDDYASLSKMAVQSSNGQEGSTNVIFYLATPPSVYEIIARNLSEVGLADDSRGWSRIVVEKPFGRDLGTARHLNETLLKCFKEQQIFRIDHYLAKETVQSILMLRFANTIFEPVWNRQFVDNIQITASETLGIENRAGYYERAGVIRDMFQNHMMQLMALISMEPPVAFEEDAVRDEKVKVFKAIKPFSLDRLDDAVVLGQYGEGEIAGKSIRGYNEENGVSTDSATPTFAAMRLFVDNWRWQGVPFYLRSGKRMKERLTEIAVQFKRVPHQMFHNVLGEDIGPNVLVLRIQPHEGIKLRFQVKLPGSKVCLRNVIMDFAYEDLYKSVLMGAYEWVLLDCILGDHTLFVRNDGVDATWSLLTPLLERMEGVTPALLLHRYRSGSWGPDAADALLKDGRDRWFSGS